MRGKRCLLTVAAAVLLMPSVTKAEVSPRLFDVYNAARGLSDNSAQTIRCTRTGRLVITTMGQINFFDGNKFSYIDPTNENTYTLSDYYGNYHLYFDKYHHLWLKNTHSVTCVDLSTEVFVKSVSDVFAEFGVKEKVKDMFVDNGGVVWLLTASGLHSVETKASFKVRDSNLQDMEVYEDKYLLLCYGNGETDVVEQSTGKVLYVGKPYGPSDYAKYDKSSVLCIDGSSCYQIRNGTKEAILLRFDILKSEWTTLLKTPYHLNNVTVQDSTLYMPCEYGYWTYDLKTGKAVQYDKVRLLRGREVSTDMNALAFDKQGGMWVGTETLGLMYSRPFNVPFVTYTWEDKKAWDYAEMMEKLPQQQQFRDKYVNCVYRDSRGWTWVGTYTGLHLYKRATDNLPQVFTKADGLLNNVVHSVVEDKRHGIWVGTSYGISLLQFNKDGEFHKIISYDAYDNVPEESFVNGRAMCLSDGMVVMQARDHVVTFYPERMRTLTNAVNFKIYPKLVGLMVNGNVIRTGEKLDGEVILEKALTRTKEINVNYNQNSLSLTFSGLNYFRPRQTYYRVRVKELDPAWKIYSYFNSGGMVDRNGQLHLPLAGLKPGTYTIELQVSMSPDNWDTEPYEWIINVHEPWWRTTGMFLLLMGILAVLVLVNIYYYLRNAKMAALKNSEEQGLIKRIKIFANACQNADGELLEPTAEEISGTLGDGGSQLPAEFVDTMLSIMDIVNEKKASQLSIHLLSEKAGMALPNFYSLMTANIYKNPRSLFKRMMLNRAQKLLATTSKDIADIASECGFGSPNYFIASFYRYTKKLPEEFRQENRSF